MHFENRYYPSGPPKAAREYIRRVRFPNHTAVVWPTVLFTLALAATAVIAEQNAILIVCAILALVLFRGAVLPPAKEIWDLRIQYWAEQETKAETVLSFWPNRFCCAQGQKESTYDYGAVEKLLWLRYSVVLFLSDGQRLAVRKDAFTQGSYPAFAAFIKPACPTAKQVHAPVTKLLVMLACCVATALPFVALVPFIDLAPLAAPPQLPPTSVSVVPPEGYWVYAGENYQSDPSAADFEPYRLIRHCTEIYGYDALSENQQKMFDLLYGQTFWEKVRLNSPDEQFPFNLPAPLTAAEYSEVEDLYYNAMDSFTERLYYFNRCGYKTVDGVGHREKNCVCGNNDDMRYHLYLSKHNSTAHYKTAVLYSILSAKADDLLLELEPTASALEKYRYIATVVAESCTYGLQKENDTTQQDKSGITTLHTAPMKTTAYGALIEGTASCEGYARAFDYLAKKLRLPSMIIYADRSDGQGAGHAWNAVQLDGNWYGVDVTWMDGAQNGQLRWQYFLFGSENSEYAPYDVQHSLYKKSPVALPALSRTAHPLPGQQGGAVP